MPHFKHITDCSLNLRGKKASPNFEVAYYILSVFPEDWIHLTTVYGYKLNLKWTFLGKYYQGKCTDKGN